VIELWHDSNGDDQAMEDNIVIGRDIMPGDLIIFNWNTSENDSIFDHAAVFLGDNPDAGYVNRLDPYDYIVHTNAMNTYDEKPQGVLGFAEKWPLHCLYYTFGKKENYFIESFKNQRFVIKRWREGNGGEK
jgi:hypothetical protein